jgi:beta-lactamase regulating signal transducer with metallopeptidase domain
MSFFTAIPDLAGELALLLLRATLLTGAAWAAATALRRAGASAAARHIAWLLGIAALLALPVLWFLVPALGLPILPVEPASAAAESPPVLAVPPFAGPDSSEAPIAAGWALLLVTVYALGAATLLLRLVAGRLTLKRLWNDAGPADPAWETWLGRLSAEIGLDRSVELRIAHGPAVPMTWGTLAPKLLLPAEASGWPAERRRLVLIHELAHVARRDSFSRSLASLACALYWFHPGVWFAARQMRLEQEHAADDRVLTAGGSAQAYALSLLNLAREAGARPQLDQAAAMAGTDQLERRLVSITGAARRNRPGAIFLSSSALIGGCTTLLVAAAVPVSATSTLPRSFDAARTGMAASPVREADSGPAGGSPAEAASADSEPSRRFARTVGPASPSVPDGAASEARNVANSGSRDGNRPPPDQSVPASEESRDTQPLSNYGWELRRRDSQIPIVSSDDLSRPARLTVPAPRDSNSSQRIGRPKWARKVPRLVQGAKPMNSSNSITEGPLMLSFSLGGDGD